MFTRTVAIALCMTLAATPAHASLILFLGTPQRIVVAADSKVGGSPEQVARYPRAGCKVAIDGRFVVGAGGERYLFRGARGVLELWRDLRAPAEALPARWQRLTDALLGEFVSDPPRDAQVGVAGFEKGLPTVVGANFDAPPGVRRLAVSNAGRAQDRISVVVPMVTDEGIDRVALHLALRAARTEDAVVALARRVIGEQARRFSDRVGGDVDIAIVEPGKDARWHTVKDACR